MLIFIGYFASIILCLGSSWAVLSKCINDGVMLKIGLIMLTFGSIGNIVHPSDQAEKLMLLAVAVILMIVSWKHRSLIKQWYTSCHN